MANVVVLDAADNVASALQRIETGETLTAMGQAVVARMEIPCGHKISLVPIPAGAPVVKYGEAIGRARCDIAPGEHVHSHNVEALFADWLAARTQGAGT